jgi:hypothetical protein
MQVELQKETTPAKPNALVGNGLLMICFVITPLSQAAIIRDLATIDLKKAPDGVWING